MSKAGKALNIVEDSMAVIGGLLLLFITFLVSLGVFSRAFLDYSLIWINEITEYSLLFIACLGGAWLLRLNGHITLDIIDFISNKKFRRIISTFVPIVGIFICTVITYYGTITTINLYERGVTSITALGIPKVYVYVVIPITFLIMGLEFVRKLYIVLIGNSVD